MWRWLFYYARQLQPQDAPSYKSCPFNFLERASMHEPMIGSDSTILIVRIPPTTLTIFNKNQIKMSVYNFAGISHPIEPIWIIPVSPLLGRVSSAKLEQCKIEKLQERKIAIVAGNG